MGMGLLPEPFATTFWAKEYLDPSGDLNGFGDYTL